MHGGQRAADEQPPHPAQAGRERGLRAVVVRPQHGLIGRERLGEHRRRDRPHVAGRRDDQPGRPLHAEQVEAGQVAQVDRRVQPERVGAGVGDPRAQRVQMADQPGIQLVPASGTRAIAAASTVSATRSSGSRLCTCDLPHARASVWVSSVIVRR